MKTSPVLLYLVTEDWYFVSHRLPMARAARDAGYRVHVATRVNRHADAIRAEGFELHPLDWQRGSANPFSTLTTIFAIRRLHRTLNPALVHHVALQPTVIGSLSALGLPAVCLNALAGLGFAFTSTTLRARVTRLVMSALLRFLLNRRRAAILVQNPDDRAAIESFGISAARVFLIPGSGVDTDVLVPLSEPPGEITAAFVGRLLDDKGVRSLVEAHRILNDRGGGVKLLLAGDPDPSNPASIPQDEIENWRRNSWLKLLGHVADIREVWKVAHIAVLPSRREGLPKSLLEAAACGRPIVATDVPGCREIARAGVNAILVPADDPRSLAHAIAALAADPALRQRFGLAGRDLVETQFSARQIGRETVALYDRLVGSEK